MYVGMYVCKYEGMHICTLQKSFGLPAMLEVWRPSGQAVAVPAEGLTDVRSLKQEVQRFLGSIDP